MLTSQPATHHCPAVITTTCITAQSAHVTLHVFCLTGHCGQGTVCAGARCADSDKERQLPRHTTSTSGRLLPHGPGMKVRLGLVGVAEFSALLGGGCGRVLSPAGCQHAVYVAVHMDSTDACIQQYHCGALTVP
jgi:hypothetical protein